MTSVETSGPTVLIATIPRRRAFCEQLLGDLALQTCPPSSVHLVLDGYGDREAPLCRVRGGLSATVMEHRTAECRGPGARWRILPQIQTSVLIVLDDDQRIDRWVVEKLVGLMTKQGRGAIAYRGTDARGGMGALGEGRPLVCACAGVLAVNPSDLQGLEETAREVQATCKFDPFGDGGDDEAVLSLHLWRRGAPITASGKLGVRTASGSQVVSQLAVRQTRRAGRSLFWQREAIRQATGWPWNGGGR